MQVTFKRLGTGTRSKSVCTYQYLLDPQLNTMPHQKLLAGQASFKPLDANQPQSPQNRQQTNNTQTVHLGSIYMSEPAPNHQIGKEQ